MPSRSNPVLVFKRAATTLVVCGLCACATQRNAPSAQEIAAARQEAQTLAARGYQPVGAPASSERFVEAWNGPDGTVMVAVIMPRDAIAAPVVLYLASPNGPADEGERWRQAWANAGYAVLSLQHKVGPNAGRRMESAPPGTPPTQSSSAPPPPPSPGGGPLTHREVDAPTAMATRQALARFALAEIASRAAQHRAPYDRMDASRIAVAGFDIGADTALALAGAHPHGAADGAARAPSAVRAVIALAPYVDTTHANPAPTYGSIVLPVLTVSGTADADRHGLVDDPHARLAPYTFMPAGGKGLLVLDGGLYTTLAGSLRPIESGGRDQARPRGGKENRGGDRSGAGGMDRGDNGGGMGGGGMGGGGMGGGMSGGGMGGGRPRGAPTQDDTPQPQIEPYAQYVIVEQVTTAYLDAYVKEDPIAQEWLQRNAPRWIGGRAQWQMK